MNTKLFGVQVRRGLSRAAWPRPCPPCLLWAAPGTARVPLPVCPPIHRLRRGCTQPEEEYGTSLRSGSIFDSQEEIPAQAGLGELQQRLLPSALSYAQMQFSTKKVSLYWNRNWGSFSLCRNSAPGWGTGRSLREGVMGENLICGCWRHR